MSAAPWTASFTYPVEPPLDDATAEVTRKLEHQVDEGSPLTEEGRRFRLAPVRH